MRSKYRLKIGKVIEMPTRMFSLNQLDDMQIKSVDEQILFNRADYDQPFVVIEDEEKRDEIKKNMAILCYTDCSKTTFSSEGLRHIVSKQLKEDSEFVVLPCFKNETEFDINEKITMAGNLKLTTNREIILEISHKTDHIVMEKIIESAGNFDHLSIFYGVHFGWHPSFSSICEKILEFKIATGKKVFCTAVPLMFAGDSKAKNSVLLPIWSLVCDGWVKNWRRGGGKGEIKLVDHIDLKNKNLAGWAENHQTTEIVRYVGITVFSLFQDTKEINRLRESYTRMLVDEILNEIASLTPSTIEAYVMHNCPAIYQTLIMRTYMEKMIQLGVDEAEWKSIYEAKEMELLKQSLRSTFSPQHLEKKLTFLPKLVEADKKVPIETLISEMEKV